MMAEKMLEWPGRKDPPATKRRKCYKRLKHESLLWALLLQRDVRL